MWILKKQNTDKEIKRATGQCFKRAEPVISQKRMRAETSDHTLTTELKLLLRLTFHQTGIPTEESLLCKYCMSKYIQ